MIEHTELTLKKIESVKQSLKNGASTLKACDEVDLSRRTFYDWVGDNPKNKAEYDKILEGRIKVVEDCLFNNCLKGKEGSIFFFLTRRAPDKWPDVSKLQAQYGTNNAKIEIIDYKEARKVIKKIQDEETVIDASTD